MDQEQTNQYNNAMNEANDINDYYKFDSPRETGSGQKKKSWKKGLLIWMSILVVVVIFGSLVALFVKSFFGVPEDILPQTSFVALIPVEGTIASGNTDSFGRAAGYQHDYTLNKLDELIENPANKALILYLDTPGGGVYESDELYFKIKEYQEKTGRPVISYMASMAASGGYYISAPADMIIANRNCWTGSIGVTVGTFYDLSDFLDKHGITTITIDSGANKSMGSLTDPMTDEQKQIFQSLVDEAYEQFAGIVAEGRNLPLDQVKKLADGRIFTAQQALDVGLIDMVASYDEALSIIGDEYDLFGLPVHEIIYQDYSLFGRLLDKMPLPVTGQNETEAILSLVKNNMAGPISYTCPLLMN